MKSRITHSHQLIPARSIRARFAQAMSNMYRFEVPLYGDLIDIVQQTNQQELDLHPELRHDLESMDSIQRLNDERHGAIRLGKAEELFNMRRLFAFMGMFPVSYYDLTEAGIPVHSTAFRPLQLDELSANPFRIFTSLLRLDLIQDQKLRAQATELLDQRKIFTSGAIELIEIFEQQQGLTSHQVDRFIAEALETFRWHHQATVDLETYQNFLNSHRLIADIVCFRGPHINHLTPRTLNIEIAQQKMQSNGMQPKAVIEGPPARQHPILLRQTSFRALEEEILFKTDNGEIRQGSHTARFGEIEQRGMALTPKGRKLYDQLLDEVRTAVPDAINHAQAYQAQLQKTFQKFPDQLDQIRQQGLGYFNYQLNIGNQSEHFTDLETLINHQVIQAYPIIYEDFLPVSAAGIFKSNLDERETQTFSCSPNQQSFEQDLGCAVINEFEYYASLQQQSLLECLQQLGVKQIDQEVILLQLDPAAG